MSLMTSAHDIGTRGSLSVVLFEEAVGALLEEACTGLEEFKALPIRGVFLLLPCL